MKTGREGPGFFGKLREDRKNYDRCNTDEGTVLRAHYFSCYRGRPVLRTGMKRSGSLGILFLKRDLSPEDGPDELRHEYGHFLQLRRMGLFRYLLGVFRPSVRGDADAPDYYDRYPWEVSADLLGGVRSRTHSPEQIRDAEAYVMARQKKKYGKQDSLTAEKR